MTQKKLVLAEPFDFFSKENIKHFAMGIKNTSIKFAKRSSRKNELKQRFGL